MARTVKEIQKQILDGILADTVFQGKMASEGKFISQSKTSLFRLWSFVVAGAIYVVELLFDNHRREMQELLAKQRAHTLVWYETRAKEFLMGKQLDPYTGQYPSDLTDEEIAQARIVTYAACQPSHQESGRKFLILKVAKDNQTGDMEALTRDEEEAFTSYLNQIQDAGVEIKPATGEAMELKMQWTVHYDPKILDNRGRRLDDPEKDEQKRKSVVEQAVRDYLKVLAFNGLYIPTYHIDYLQTVQGVVIPLIDNVQAMDPLTGQWKAVEATGVRSGSGWFHIDPEANLTINYEVFTGDGAQ